MRIPKYLFICGLVFAVLMTWPLSSRAESVYAVINCKIVPVTSPTLEKGVIIIRNGLIVALGLQEKTAIPYDAEVIDGEGLVAYPGLIDTHSGLFLEMPEEEPSPAARLPVRTQEESKRPEPDVQAYKFLKPRKTTMESFHRIGITTVLVAPSKGIFAGQSVLLNLNSESVEKMVLKNPVALHIHFTTERGSYPSSLMGTMAFLRQSFLDAGHYSTHKSMYARSAKGLKRPEYDPFLDSLLPYVVDKNPVVFHCGNQEDIKRALRLTAEFKLNALLSGANEAWRVSEHIRRAGIPLLVSLDYKPPITSMYAAQGEDLKTKAEKEIYPGNSSRLHKDKIRFALTSFGLKDANSVLKNIQEAVKAGLPREEALKAMTVVPAEFLGLNSVLGSLEPGKIANVILTSGEIFDEKTRVERVFVDGISFSVKKPAKDAAAAAVNLSGKWRASVSGPMGEMEMTVEIEQEENQVSGTITSNLGIWEISDGLLSGKDLTFVLTATIMGETMEMSFKGTAEKDAISGTISFMGGSAELRATRLPGVS